MKNYVLSIIIPIRNEIHYLSDLLDEINLIKEDDVEIVISDNFSDDGSYEFLLKQKNDKIKIVRPFKRCSPFENHKYALSCAKGRYVFAMGGDDILLSEPLGDVIKLIRKHKDIIVVARIQTFNDSTNAVILETNTNSEIEFFFKNEKFSLRRSLSYANYDQMLFSFIPRSNQKFMNKLDPMCYETFAVWSNFYNFYNRSLSEIYYTDKVIYKKRYFKKNESGNFAKDQGMNDRTNNLKKFKGTIKNSLDFLKVHRNLKDFIFLLFYNRKIIGDYGTKRILSPFMRVIRNEISIFLKFF